MDCGQGWQWPAAALAAYPIHRADRHARALALAGCHRVGCVAQEGGRAVGPGGDWVAVADVGDRDAFLDVGSADDVGDGVVPWCGS